MTAPVSTRPALLHEALTKEILGSFFTVYNALGYGFLEAVYFNAMCIELPRRGIELATQVPVVVKFDEAIVGEYRADIVCEGKVLVELKAGPSLPPSAHAQTLNYVRAMNLPLGLLLQFGPKPEFHRVINQRHIH